MVYDLTTKKNLAKSYEYLGLVSVSPIFAIGKYVFDKILGEETSPEEQRKAALALIQEAKKQGAKSIELDMDSSVGGGLGTTIEGFPIKVEGRMGNKMRVRVDFK